MLSLTLAQWSEITKNLKFITVVNDTAENDKFFAGVNDTANKTVLPILACLHLKMKNKQKSHL
jgi:hypothetical protein